MFFFIVGIAKPQECTGQDLAVLTNPLKPMDHPRSHFILEPWTLQFAIKKQTKDQTKLSKTFCQAGDGSMVLRSGSIEILPETVAKLLLYPSATKKET